MSKMKWLFESKPLEFVDDLEELLKDKLIANLRDDGKGHHHAKYAKRLEKFDMQIVPLEVDPMFTAGIHSESGIIYFGEGFLINADGENILTADVSENEKEWDQLNVLIRHELAHHLLAHQIRLAAALGEKTHIRTKFSQSLNRLKNIVSDDEIANLKYSEADKEIVRTMTLNGELIGGLITEDHRKDWVNLSVVEMYKKLEAEINAVHKQLSRGKKWSEITADMDLENDPVHRQIVHTYEVYADTESDSFIPGDLKTFIDSGYQVDGAAVKKDLADIIQKIYNVATGKSLSDSEIQTLITNIAQSSPVKKFDVFGNKKVEVYTPEEKFIAIETLKKFRSEYSLWYNRVMSSLDKLTEDELRELAELLK